MERQKTTIVTPNEADRRWVVVDVKDQIVGRVASSIAGILRGKDRPTFTPHVDNGDFVVVINAARIRFTGNKLIDKRYHSHSGYPGGAKSVTAGKQLERHPERVLADAVWGMLPKNRLSRHLMRKLKIYPGTEHPHEAQAPQAINIESTL